MACDLCGAVGTYLEDLLDGYKTDEVKAVCPDCAAKLTKHITRIRDVQHGMLRQLMRRYITNKRAERIANSAVPVGVSPSSPEVKR